MAGHFVNQGEQIFLEAGVGKTAGQLLKLILVKNNFTDSEALTEAGITEATFTGYAAINLAGASWTFTAGDPSHLDYALQSFTCSAEIAAENIYGWALLQQTSGKLVAVEKWSDGPYPQAHIGDAIQVTPVINLGDGTGV